MVETVVVPFDGTDSGESALTWGQQHIWDWISTSGAPLSMSVVRELPAGTKVDEPVDQLRFFMNRFQAMRTRLRLDGDGRVRQVVAGSGAVTLEIVDADAEPAAVAAAVKERHEATHFDYFHEWPVRMTLIRHDGALTHQVTTLCHLVLDAAAAMVMVADLLDAATGPLTGLTPLRLAQWQALPAGRRQSDAALRHWEAQLRTLPAAPADVGVGGFWQLEYDSAALCLATHAIADQVGADTAAVLLAAYAVTLARLTGRNPGALELIVSNRFRPGYAASVSPVNQTGLCVLDVAGCTFAEAVELARRRTFSACKHAYFDPVRQRELIARVAHDRGIELDLGYFVNDRRSRTTRPPDAPRPTAAEIRAALPHSVLRRRELGFFNKKLMVYFSDAPDATSVMLQADGRVMLPDTVETLVRDMEALTVAAAADPTLATGVPVRSS